MDTRDGRIYTPEEMKKMFGEVAVKDLADAFRISNELFKDPWKKIRVKVPEGDIKYFMPMEVAPTEKQLARRPPKVGRNEPCPCGSGKKFKKCCLNLVGKEQEEKR